MSRGLGDQKIRNSYLYLLQRRDGVVLDGNGNVVNLEGRVVLTEHTSGSLGGMSVYWFADTTSGSVQGELNPEGDKIFIKDSGGNASNDPIYIYAPAGQTINGNASEAIDVDWGWVEYYRVGSEWKTLAGQGYIPPAPEIPTPEEVGAIPASEKGAANGVATLGADSLVVQNPADLINLNSLSVVGNVPSTLNWQKTSIWDNFNRPDSPTAGNALSGQAWQTIIGTGSLIIEGTYAIPQAANSCYGIPITVVEQRAFKFSGVATTMSGTARQNYIYIGVDNQNYIRISFSISTYDITVVTAGVATSISSGSYTFVGSGAYMARQEAVDLFYEINYNINRNNMTESVVTIMLGYNRGVNITFETPAFITAPSDITFVGIGSNRGKNPYAEPRFKSFYFSMVNTVNHP